MRNLCELARSDISDLESDDSEDDDYEGTLSPASNSSSTGDVSSENVDDETVSSHSSTTVIRWRRVPIFDINQTWLDTFPPPPATTKTPLEYFHEFVTHDMLEKLAYQTNLYSVQVEGSSIATTVKEMEQFLGIYLTMGIVQMREVRMYWSQQTRYEPIASVMSRDRYLKLRRHLHFVDNTEVNHSQDKLKKMRWWIDDLCNNFRKIPNEEHQAVDEIIVPFKGSTAPIRQYIPSKPHPWGLKLWARAGSSGIVYQFEVYQGSGTFSGSVDPSLGTGGSVVYKLCADVPRKRGYKIFADNFFSSINLVNKFSSEGIFYCGTIRANRIPASCPLKSQADLKRSGRGSSDFKTDRTKSLTIVRWFDNKAVSLISNFVGVEPENTCERFDRRTKQTVSVRRPAIVQIYNVSMGGVDTQGGLCNLYRRSYRSKRWYLSLFFYTITMSTVNAWLFYKRHCTQLQSSPIPLQEFQAQLARSLILNRAGRPSVNAPTAPKRSCPIPSTSSDIRKDGVGHFPKFQEKRGRCAHCHVQQSFVHCVKCDVILCIVKDRNCFYNYHCE
jgi:hypothetical protein